MFDFQTFPILRTKRLILRDIVRNDADAIFAIRSDYQVTHYNIGAAYTDTKQAQKLIENMTKRYQQREELRWGITYMPDDTVIGMCGFNYWDRVDRRGSIGFDLNRHYWRRGIMREALRRILRFGFEAMKLNRIEADVSAENAASLALLKSLGFQQEGYQREQYFDEGTFHDLVLLALLKREWQARSRP